MSGLTFAARSGVTDRALTQHGVIAGIMALATICKAIGARATRGAALAAGALTACALGACAAASPQRAAPLEPRSATAPTDVFSFTPAQFQMAFDRQARADRTDRTLNCVEVHWVTQCGFQTHALDRLRAAQADGRSPEIGLDFARQADGFVSAIDLDANLATPTLRLYYVGQFKTLVRTLAPKIDKAILDAMLERLHLLEDHRAGDTSFTADFALVSCHSDGVSLSCSLDRGGR